MSALRTRSLLLFSSILLSLPSLALALPAGLTRSLRPLDGVIVMPLADEYLIDLDASKGIAEGDIFSVIIPGPAVVHPLTGEVIGSLDEVEGWLEVTRLKSGYSYVHPLNPDVQFDKKDKIRRFTNLPAVFWDYTGSGEKVFNELRAELPHLEWHTYLADQAQRPSDPTSPVGSKPALTFIYQTGELQVVGLNSRLLGKYPVAAIPSKPAPITMAQPTAAAALVLPASPPANTAIIKSERQTTSQSIVRNQSQDEADIWSSASIAGNPIGIEIADLDADGMNEVAILHKGRLEIGRFNGREYRKLHDLPLKGIDKTLMLSSADLDADGRPELFISAMDGLKVSSLIVAAKGNSYSVAQANLPWFLRAIQNPDGSKMVLGQRLGNKVDIFDQKIDKIAYQGGKYTSAGEYNHPWQTNLFSLQPLTGATDTTAYAEISANDRLRFFSADYEELWESSESYGGDLVFFSRDDRTGGADNAQVPVYLKPRLALLDSTTLLAPQNEGWRISSTFQSVGPGRVSALRWDGSSLVELWHTAPQQGSLADFQYADIDNDQKPEVILLMHFKRSGLLSKGKSGLKVFEID